MPRHKIYFPHFVKLNHNSFSESWQFESLPWLQLCGAALLSLGELGEVGGAGGRYQTPQVSLAGTVSTEHLAQVTESD